MARNNNRGLEMIHMARFLGEYSNDPRGFGYAAVPWGEGVLEGMDGPQEWQKDVLNKIKNGQMNLDEVTRIAVASGNGIGKMHGYAQKLYTPKGEVTWGSLKIGDYLFSPDGGLCKIIQTHHYKNVPMYRVTFDDGSYADASSGHLWTVKGRQQRRNGLGWITVETIDLANGRLRNPSNARQWEIPRHKPVAFDAQSVPIHPYVFGLWLSEGHKGTPVFTKSKEEVVDRVRSFGYDVSTKGDGKTRRILGHNRLFAEYDGTTTYDHERFIPEAYKCNSVENRMELLYGLMDGDGECMKHGTTIYSTTSKQLAKDVVWLVRSLGGKAHEPKIKHGWYNDTDGNRVDCKDCYRVTITLPFNPFHDKERAKRWHMPEERYLKRFIDKIEPIENRDGMCVTVDREDGLYLTNDFIVTHNSALVAWCILWAISTHEDTRGTVTANTEVQLRTKTWAELSKWYQLFIGKDLFVWAGTSIVSSQKGHEGTWRVDAIPWSATNPEAFAGLHNKGKRLFLIMDEASAIDSCIWEAAEGAMTDANTEILWLCFGNPTRNEGRFFDCFHRFRNIWDTRQIDSRTVEISNKKQLQQWVDTYGIDSDFVKVHILGQFPSASEYQFISMELAEKGRGKKLLPREYNFATKVLAIDPAWTGGDATAIVFRQGLKATLLKLIPRNDNDMYVAQLLAMYEDKYGADAVFIDLGYGTGIFSAGKTMGRNWMLVGFGEKSPEKGYYNMRAYMWGQMRQWLIEGGSYDDNQQWLDDLTGVQVKPRVDGVVQLESKEDMKKRGLASPNIADALALTFARPIVKNPFQKRTCNTDYNPFPNRRDKRNERKGNHVRQHVDAQHWCKS